MELEQIQNIIAEARAEAHEAAHKFFTERLGGRDQYACGFAWVNIHEYQNKKIDGRTRLGRLFRQAGVDRDWTGVLQIWNPSGFGVQNVDTLEAGARAAAEVFRRHGFTAYAGSRLD